jgi:putative hydrolase of the HAD superfamily
MKPLITFDLDNTLWHVDNVIHRATKIKFQWLAENYPKITEALGEKEFTDIRNNLIAHNPAILADLTQLRKLTIEKSALEVGIEANEAKQLSEKSFEIFFRERNRVELFPHTKEMLETLVEDFQLIALSNGNADLNVIGIADYFVAHYKPTDVGAPKPEPHMFERALETAKVSAKESIHIGDDLVCDIEGAKALGFKTIFSNILKKDSPETEAMADATVTHLKEIPEVVQKLI